MRLARRDSRTTLAVAALAALLGLAGCSAQPVSQAGLASFTPAPTVATASAEPSSSGGEPSASAPAASYPPPTTVPPKPGNPTFELVKETPNPDGTVSDEYRLTWTSPPGMATKFLVYGVNDCLRYAKKYDGKPCVVKGMRIPKDKLVLLTTAPGDAREATVTWDAGEAGPPPYAAVLIRASNDIGDSIFTIAHSENVCWGCTY